MSTPRDLALALVTTGDAIRHRLDGALGAAVGLSLGEHQLLRALAGERPVARVELARAVGLTPSGVTRALRPLEKLGFVATQRDARDARRSLAALTDDGRARLADADAVVDDAVAALAGIQALDRREVDALLGRLEAVRA